MVIAGLGREVVGWMFPDGKEVFRIANTEHDHRRRHYTCVDAGNTKLVAGSLDHTVQSFLLTEDGYSPLHRTELSNTVHSIEIESEEHVAYAGCFDGQIAAIDTDSGALKFSSKMHRCQVNRIKQFSNDLFVSGTIDGELAIWEPKENEIRVICYLQLSPATPIISLDALDDRILVVQEGAHAAISWNLTRILDEFDTLGLSVN